MPITKINDAALEEQGKFHACLDDVPGLTAEQMKEFFDYIPREVIIPKVNELTDAANAAASGLAGKLDKSIRRTSPSDMTALFSATLATDDQPVTFSVSPHNNGYGYTDGVEICGSAPVFLGSNVQIPLKVPALTLGPENTVLWSYSGAGSYTGGNIPDFLLLHADSPFVYMHAYLQNTEGISGQFDVVLTNVSKGGAVAFTTPPIYDADYDTVFMYVFRNNEYYCKQL